MKRWWRLGAMVLLFSGPLFCLAHPAQSGDPTPDPHTYQELRAALSSKIAQPFAPEVANEVATQCDNAGIDEAEICALRHEALAYSCDQKFVACVYACDGRILSSNMSQGAFPVRSGESWTVKVVGPERCADDFAFADRTAKSSWSVFRSTDTDAPATKDGGAAEAATKETKSADATAAAAAGEDTPEAALRAVETARSELAATSSPAPLAARRTAALNASGQAVLASGDGRTIDNAKVVAALTAANAYVDDAAEYGPLAVRAGALRDALRKLLAALTPKAKPTPEVTTPKTSQDAEVRDKWRLFAAATFTVSDELSMSRQEITVSSRKTGNPFTSIVRFNIVDHGRYAVDFKFGGVLVLGGRDTYSIIAPNGSGSRAIVTSSTIEPTFGFFMDMFPFGGRRRGIIMPWAPFKSAGNVFADLVGLELGLQLDFAHITDLERFTRRGFLGILIEPITGISLSFGLSLGVQQQLREGYRLPDGAAAVPAEAFKDGFAARPYFAFTFSPDVISFARTALAGIPGGGSQTQKEKQ